MQHRYLIVGVEDLVVMEMMLEKPTSHCTEVELVSDEHERRPSQIVFKVYYIHVYIHIVTLLRSLFIQC